jgi:subtilase family serine protease
MVKSLTPTKTKIIIAVTLLVVVAALTAWVVAMQHKKSSLDGFTARPYEIARRLVHPNIKPKAMITPAAIKNYYKLPATGGSGTIAIIDAYDDPAIEKDLGTFSQQYGLPSCTTANGCFEKHLLSNRTSVSSGWALEEALDVEWAHAVAPNAKVLLIEARSASGNDLMNAIKYAAARADVVSVSMSWGGAEFSGETAYESAFSGVNHPVFFAASGDSGHGTSWPAASAKVISVGGTSLATDSTGNVTSETAWSGSGGGLSQFISAPAWQTTYGVPQANGKRAMPDVAYNADPNSGFPVYSSVKYYGSQGWFQVGGTSAGTPQWAAMHAISSSVNNNQLYIDAAVAGQAYLRDITSGTNGTCGAQCTATTGYDYVTGLGTPLTTSF